MVTVSLLEKKLNNLVRAGMGEYNAKETLIDTYPDWADLIDDMTVDAIPGEAKPTFVPTVKAETVKAETVKAATGMNEQTHVIKTELVVNPSEFMENAWRFMSPKDALKHLLNHLPSEDISSVMGNPESSLIFYRNVTDKNVCYTSNPVVVEEPVIVDQPVVVEEPVIVDQPVVELPRVLTKRQQERAEKLRLLMALQG